MGLATIDIYAKTKGGAAALEKQLVLVGRISAVVILAALYATWW